MGALPAYGPEEPRATELAGRLSRERSGGQHLLPPVRHALRSPGHPVRICDVPLALPPPGPLVCSWGAETCVLLPEPDHTANHLDRPVCRPACDRGIAYA